MNFLLLLIGMLVISLSTFAVDVPKVVADAFAKKFPSATNIKWGKENAKEYEAEFKINGKSMSANFLSDASWVETEAEIATSEIPAAVKSVVEKKYPGAVISKVFKIDNVKGEVTYEAEIKTGNKKKEVNLKVDGTILK